MIELELSILIGIISIVLIICSAVITRDRVLTKQIHDNHVESLKAIKTGDDSLKKCLDEQKLTADSRYSRKQETDARLERIEDTLSMARQEHREDMKSLLETINPKLDRITEKLMDL